MGIYSGHMVPVRFADKRVRGGLGGSKTRSVGFDTFQCGKFAAEDPVPQESRSLRANARQQTPRTGGPALPSPNFRRVRDRPRTREHTYEYNSALPPIPGNNFRPTSYSVAHQDSKPSICDGYGANCHTTVVCTFSRAIDGWVFSLWMGLACCHAQ